MHIVYWLESATMVPRIQDYQQTADDGGFMDYAGDARTLPTDPNDWDWHDNKFAGEYLCDRVQTTLEEDRLYDALGSEIYLETIVYNYDCYLMTIYALGRMRLHFWIPYEDETFRGEFFNNSTVGLGRQEATDEELSTVTFETASNYKVGFSTYFSPDLQGINCYSYALSTKIANDTEAYNGWNFTSTLIWDSVEQGFWFAPTTMVLWQTDGFDIID